MRWSTGTMPDGDNYNKGFNTGLEAGYSKGYRAALDDIAKAARDLHAHAKFAATPDSTSVRLMDTVCEAVMRSPKGTTRRHLALQTGYAITSVAACLTALRKAGRIRRVGHWVYPPGFGP